MQVKGKGLMVTYVLTPAVASSGKPGSCSGSQSGRSKRHAAQLARSSISPPEAEPDAVTAPLASCPRHTPLLAGKSTSQLEVSLSAAALAAALLGPAAEAGSFQML